MRNQIIVSDLKLRDCCKTSSKLNDFALDTDAQLNSLLEEDCFGIGSKSLSESDVQGPSSHDDSAIDLLEDCGLKDDNITLNNYPLHDPESNENLEDSNDSNNDGNVQYCSEDEDEIPVKSKKRKSKLSTRRKRLKGNSLEKKIFSCEECNKTFKNRYYYEVHNSNHTGRYLYII